MRKRDRQLVSERVRSTTIAKLKARTTESLLENFFHPAHSSSAKNITYEILIERGTNPNQACRRPQIETVTVPGFEFKVF
jgi:hypothetical protein